jgi:peptidoglycan DL-endopeptidase CwlO
MLSIVPVISITLLASVASSRPDSARVLGAHASVRSDSIAKPSTTSTAPELTKSSVLATASRYVGTRYRFGGTKPGAFDCSGFVRYVFARHGVVLPRTAHEQSAMGLSIVVGPDSLQAGDLLFFRTKRGLASHVAIYAGGGRIIHASAGSRRVRFDDLGSPRGRWFIEHLSSVRRVSGIEPPESGKLETGSGN